MSGSVPSSCSRGAGQHGAQGHDDEPQHAQRDDGGGDSGLHLMDAPRPEELGDHHVAAHGQAPRPPPPTKTQWERRSLRPPPRPPPPHELPHHHGVHHVVQLLEQIARHHWQGKEKQQLQGLSPPSDFEPYPLSFSQVLRLRRTGAGFKVRGIVYRNREKVHARARKTEKNYAPPHPVRFPVYSRRILR